ncbi:hypothetical protein AAEX28_13350 [Lentisphaerota bacterium WC36G]
MKDIELVKGGCGHTSKEIENSAYYMGISFIGLIITTIIGVILS